MALAAGSSSVHLTGTASIHWYSCELIRVPITSGICCPLGSVNRLWERKPGDRQSRQAGAGKYEHSPAKIRRTNVASRKDKSGCVPAKIANVLTDFGFPRRVAGWLFHDKKLKASASSQFDPGATEPRPKTGACALAVDGRRNACFLAWRAADEDISVGWVKRADVVMDGYSGVILSEALPAPFVALAQLNGLDPCPGKSGRVVSEAGERVARPKHSQPYLTCQGMSRHVLTLVDTSSMRYGMNTMPRLKKPVSTTYDPELLARLEAWIAKQEFPPDKVAVFETALREFLEKRERKR